MFKKIFIGVFFFLFTLALFNSRPARAEGDGPEFINLPILVFSENKEGAYHLIRLYQIVFGNITPTEAQARAHIGLRGLIYFYEQSCNNRTPEVCMREFVPNPPCNCSLPSAPSTSSRQPVQMLNPIDTNMNAFPSSAMPVAPSHKDEPGKQEAAPEYKDSEQNNKAENPDAK